MPHSPGARHSRPGVTALLTHHQYVLPAILPGQEPVTEGAPILLPSPSVCLGHRPSHLRHVHASLVLIDCLCRLHCWSMGCRRRMCSCRACASLRAWSWETLLVRQQGSGQRQILTGSPGACGCCSRGSALRPCKSCAEGEDRRFLCFEFMTVLTTSQKHLQGRS